MASRIIFSLFFFCLALATKAQITTDVKDYQIARMGLGIGNDTLRLRSIVKVITAAATHNQSPTAKAVYDYCSTLSTNLSYTGTTSPVTLNSSTGTDVTVTAGTGIGLAATGSNMTVTNTGDLSATNEAQSLTSSTNTVTLSAVSGVGGGTVTVDTDPTDDVTGSGATNYLAKFTGTKTIGNSIAYDDGTRFGIGVTAPEYKADILGNLNLRFSGQNPNTASGWLYLGTATNGVNGINSNNSMKFNNSGGLFGILGNFDSLTQKTTGEVIIQGRSDNNGASFNSGITFVTGGNATTNPQRRATINNNGAFQIYNLAGTGSRIVLADASGNLTANSVAGSPIVGVSGGTGISVSTSSGVATVTNTGDLSAANEGILGVGAGGSTTATITSNTTGANGVTIAGAGIATVSEATNSNGGTITITATEADGSPTNEGALTVGAGGSTSATIASNTSGSTPVTIAAGAGIDITETTGSGGTIIVGIAGGGTPWVLGGNTVAANGRMGTNNDFPLTLETNNIDRIYMAGGTSTRIGIGNTAPVTELDFQGSTGGIRVPRGSILQRPENAGTAYQGVLRGTSGEAVLLGLEYSSSANKWHALTSDVLPAFTVGNGAGTGATAAAAVGGNELSHTVQLNTGSSGFTPGGTVWARTFAAQFTNSPTVMLTAANSLSATDYTKFWVEATVTGYTVRTNATLSASNVYRFHVQVKN